MNDMSAPRRDKPWMFRTYAGHSTAGEEANKLYRSNLAKGQTGLSIAFDLPTQTGYDSDHILSRGEVGKVGIRVPHLGDMRTLFHGIPLSEMNTSMTINATAVWLMALYIAAAEEQGAPRGKLQGTTQNDIIKEYLSRGSYVFPPTQRCRGDGEHRLAARHARRDDPTCSQSGSSRSCRWSARRPPGHPCMRNRKCAVMRRILGIDPGGVPGAWAILDKLWSIISTGDLPFAGTGAQHIAWRSSRPSSSASSRRPPVSSGSAPCPNGASHRPSSSDLSLV